MMSEATAALSRPLPLLRQLSPAFNFAPVPFFLPNQSLARLGTPDSNGGMRPPIWVAPQLEQLVVDQELAKDLSCGICLQLLTEPRQCKNGHLFCHECIVASLEKQPECPLCRCSFTLENISRNLIVDRHLRELKLYCRHSFSLDPSNPAKVIHDSGGCKEIVIQSTREGHESSCPYACFTSHSSTESGSFAWEVCRFSSQCVACKHCQNPVPEGHTNVHLISNIIRLHTYEEHYESCPEMLEACICCTVQVKRRDMKAHLDVTCPECPVSCEFGGCVWQGARKIYKQHLSTSAVEHLTATKKEFETAIAAMQEQYTKLLEIQNERIVKLEGNLAEKDMKVVWKIRNFRDQSKERFLTSEPFLAGDFTWFLVLFPNGDTADAKGWISMFLNADPEDLPRGKAVTVDFSITVVNQKTQSASVRREFASHFPLGGAEGSGDRRLISAARLTEENGFLKQGMLVLEVSFFVRRQAWMV